MRIRLSAVAVTFVVALVGCSTDGGSERAGSPGPSRVEPAPTTEDPSPRRDAGLERVLAELGVDVGAAPDDVFLTTAPSCGVTRREVDADLTARTCARLHTDDADPSSRFPAPLYGEECSTPELTGVSRPPDGRASEQRVARRSRA